ncbi:hypothetical protein E4U40_000234 [Claviceps sp. LM458 group G5]|nr:hypothetical protein E4U40_000234 [Claviceps sp. LM458 group G5]
MDAMQTHLAETEFEDIIGPIEELGARVTFELHLLSSRADHYRAGMHPDAVCAETIHNTSTIPDYPISAMKGFAYIIRTDELAEEDVETPWKSKFNCSGSKHCQHIDSKLLASYFDVETLSYFEDREAIQDQYAQPSGLEKAAVVKTDNKDDPHHFTMVSSRYDGNITALQILKANFNNYELQHTNSGSPCFQVNEKAKKKKTCGKF